MAEQFMYAVDWFFNAIRILWDFLTSIGFVGWLAIGLLVFKRVAKLVGRVLHK